MRIAQINISSYGSTGKIMLQIAQEARTQGHDVLTFSRKWWRNKEIEGHQYFGLPLEHALHHATGYITGDEGYGSVISTAMLIRKLKKFRPDVLLLHNLHGWYICLPMLFDYIRREGIRTVWTFHDCWPFTGHCPYFDFVKCDRWKEECGNCPSFRNYPASLFDNSRKMLSRKKKWFTGIRDMQIICPSEWLADLVSMSSLIAYPVSVIHNWIDLSVFKYRDSEIRARYSRITDSEKVVMGVAFDWEKRKGLDVFLSLREMLGDGYRIVLVGTDEKTDELLPDDIISIHRTENQEELAELYSAADVFVNPTREDNYPTVNMEAIACGTPVATFRTGGSPESVPQSCGIVVGKDDTESLAEAVIKLCENREGFRNSCIRYAVNFSSSEMTSRYLDVLIKDGGKKRH